MPLGNWFKSAEKAATQAAERRALNSTERAAAENLLGRYGIHPGSPDFDAHIGEMEIAKAKGEASSPASLGDEIPQERSRDYVVQDETSQALGQDWGTTEAPRSSSIEPGKELVPSQEGGAKTLSESSVKRPQDVNEGQLIGESYTPSESKDLIPYKEPINAEDFVKQQGQESVAEVNQKAKAGDPEATKVQRSLFKWIKENPLKTAAGLGTAGYVAKRVLSDEDIAKAGPPKEGESVPVNIGQKQEEPKPSTEIKDEEGTNSEVTTPEEQTSAPQEQIQDAIKTQQAGPSLIDRLKEAQQQQKQNIAGSNLQYYSGMIGGALGRTANPLDEMSKRSLSMADLPIKNLIQQVEMEKHDPQSEISKTAQKFLRDRLGVNVGNVSAADLEKVNPVIARVIESEENRKSRQLVAEQNRIAKQEASVLKQKETKEKTNTKRFDDLGKKLVAEMGSSRSAFGKAGNVVRSAESIEQLVGSGDLNKLDSRQIQEVARNLDTMLSMGQATVSGTAKLVPHTWKGTTAGYLEQIMNKPMGAEQGLFIKRMMETVKREKELAGEQIKRTQNKVLGSYMDLQKEDPEKWNTVMTVHGLNPDLIGQTYEMKQDKKDPKVEGYAKDHNLSYEQASGILEKRGYKIGGE